MKTMQFCCRLKSDVILNVKSASEGNNATLDFIPGSCFLGIVAGSLYGKLNEEENVNESLTVFHSGTVRFGDAHPALGQDRALRVPASFFYAKGDKLTDACYIHHFIENPQVIMNSDGKRAQLKQARSGFYVMNAETGKEIKTSKHFAIKSAYNREERRSMDAKMFGYESLAKGLELLFEVEMDDELSSELSEKIKNALLGEHSIGRSRTAQYGLVEITEGTINAPVSQSDATYLTVYADARLIFLDDNGNATFCPTVQQLLGKDVKGDIDWQRSQVRTFQYAPWNAKRQCFDTDRCGIEKGSVFVLTNVEGFDKNVTSQYVGSYKNEGFGKVLYNPAFLQQGGENGLAKIKIEEAKEPKTDIDTENAIDQNLNPALMTYLQGRQKAEAATQTVLKKVNGFNDSLFKGKEKFASQWGTIRSIALRNKENDTIYNEVIEYISHGVKSEDWTGPRVKALQDFMDDNRGNLWAAIINLASQMAKECGKDE